MLIKLPFGIRNGKLVHISEIQIDQNGLNCNCVCPECGEKLIARKGDIRIHHFAHHNDNCINPLETALHYYAKEVLKKYKKLKLPDVILEYFDYSYYNIGSKNDFYYKKSIKYEKLYDEKIMQFEQVECEKSYGDLKPDIILYKDNVPLFIEIAVTNFVDDDKLQKIIKTGISTIEIFLDIEDIDFYDFDKEKIENLIIESTISKFWLYNKKLEEKRSKKNEEVKEYRDRQLEIHKNTLKVNKQKYLTKLEKLKKYEDKKYRDIKVKEFSKTIRENSIWLRNVKNLDIRLEEIPEFINLEVEGELSINCDRRIWQSSIFTNFIINRKGKEVFTKNVVTWIKKYSEIPLNKDLIYTNDITEINIPDLTDCIYNYLMSLVEYGFLTIISCNHRYYSKFKVNYGEIKSLKGLSKEKIKEKTTNILEQEEINHVYINQHTNQVDYSVYQPPPPKPNHSANKNLWLNKEGVCRVCKKITRDWVVFDGKNNTCLCRDCDKTEREQKKD